MSAQNPRPTPKPWPMKWIIVAIVAFAAVYTVIDFYYRKPGQAYRPYQDAQNRATTSRLLAAGWQKMKVDTRRPAEKSATDLTPAKIARDFPGIGPDLESKFAEKPSLIATIDHVFSPSVVKQGESYTAYFTASLANLHDQVGDIALYRKGTELVLVPSTEALPGQDLKSRWNDSNYWVSFSTENLPPGNYQIRIVARGPAAAWSFLVQ